MTEYSATISWRRDGQAFVDNCYSRAHAWQFDGGLTVPASASPHIVPLPQSVPENVDPEEAFVAALSSCHMLFFLSFAAAQGIIVDRYDDHAVGYLQKDDTGRLAMTRVVLRPQAAYAGDRLPQRAEIEALHDRAHASCFIANSVHTEVVTELVA